MMQSAPGLVGRDAELALLGGMLTDVVAGRGRVVLVEGEAGIGKSALLEAGLAGAGEAGCQVLRGTCGELAQHFPLAAALETLGVEEGSGHSQRAAVARSLAGSPGGSALGLRLAAGDPVMAAVEQLVALVDKLCADGPVVILLEDLHWADEATLVLWWRLMRASRQLPLLLAGSCRPWPVPRELGRLRGELREPTGMVVSLTGLSAAEVGSLVQDRVGSPPGSALAGFLQSAGGNPFYIRELVDTLVRSGALTDSAGYAELTPARNASPTQDWSQVRGWAQAVWSLTDAIEDRLSSLSPAAGRALGTAALLGPTFSVADLAVALAGDLVAVVDLVREAIGAGVLEADGARLRFRHGLLREVLYQGMALPVRTALHRQVFEAFIAAGVGAERVAVLLLPVLEAADGWELDWIVEHAGTLVDRAPEIACDLLQHALGRLRPGDPRRLSAASTFLPACVYLRRSDEAEAIAQELLSQQDLGPEQAGQAFWFLARSSIQSGRPAAAIEVATQALASDQLSPMWRARLTATLATGLAMTRRTEEARREAQAALAVGEQLSDALTEGFALHILGGVALSTDDVKSGIRYLDRAANILRGNDPALTNLAMLVGENRIGFSAEQDDFDRAEEQGYRLLALAEHTWTTRQPSIRVRLAETAYFRGRWDDAQAQLELADDPHGSKSFMSVRHSYLAAIAARRNEWERASSHLAAIAELNQDTALGLNTAPILLARVLCAERSGAPEQVMEVLAPCLTIGGGLYLADQNMLLPALVRAAAALGDETTLQAVRDFYSTPGADGQRPPRHTAGGWWVRGLLTGDPGQVLAAAAYLRSAGRLAWLGGALEDQAVLQATAGDLESARSTITEALEVYVSLGAVWDARRAAARIREHGVHQGVRSPRRRPRSGWAALSDTEARVAAMVAQGLSNPDIADQLVLSRRTVETHVSHILAKLQVRSRREVIPPTGPSLVTSS